MKKMAYDIALCNENAVTLLGSDGNFNIDNRLSIDNIRRQCAEYRERFKVNFDWKFKYWTHFRYRGKIYKM